MNLKYRVSSPADVSFVLFVVNGLFIFSRYPFVLKIGLTLILY